MKLPGLTPELHGHVGPLYLGGSPSSHSPSDHPGRHRPTLTLRSLCPWPTCLFPHHPLCPVLLLTTVPVEPGTGLKVPLHTHAQVLVHSSHFSSFSPGCRIHL